MTRRVMISFALVAVALVVLATPALAGGWAVVTLDSLPREVRAGQTLHLGFMVRQHGKTPIDGVEAYVVATKSASAGGALDRVVGVTTAHAQDTQRIQVQAKKEGPVGHYVVDVTFPAAGAWEWEIIPAPFGGTKLAPLTVLTAVPGQSAAPSAPVAQPAESAAILGIAPAALRLSGLVLLVVAAGLALASIGVRGRRLAPR